jgi:glycosyltransferase involved in cell wall biosynthesis
MDWRDPWTFNEFLGDFDKQQYMKAELPRESACLREASAVVVNSAPVQHELVRRYPGIAQRVTTIPNGADAEELPEWPASGKMRIVYAGALFAGRDPRLFMQGLAEAITVHGVPGDDVVLQFVTGTPEYEGRPLHELARAFGVEQQVEVLPFMPRHALLDWLAGTAVNVLVQVPSTYQIPAKLFEYMQMPAWLVAVTNAPNAISDILSGSTAIVVAPDASQLGEVFATIYRRRAAGERPSPVNDGRFDRERRAREMLDVLDHVVSGSDAAGASPPT